MRMFIPLFAALSAYAQINFPPDLFISRLEVVQTVQDEDQNVPLTAGKATAVRAFVKQEGRPESLVANITVALRGFRDGTELPNSPLRAINPAITARPAPDRASFDHSQNFVLPAAWTAAGPLELRAELRLPPNTPETPAGNNNMTRQVEFFPPPASPVIAWLPLCIGTNCVTSGVAHQRLAERLFPFADGSLRYEDVPVPAVTWGRPPIDDASSAALAAHLKKWLLLLGESPTPAHVLAAWLPRGASTPAASGGPGDAFWIVEQPDTAGNEQLLARQLASGYNVVSDDPCGAFILDPGFDPVSGIVQSGSKLEFPALCPAAPDTPWVSAGLAHYLANNLPAFRVSNTAAGSSRLLISGTVREDGSVAFTGFLRASSRVRATLSPVATGFAIRIADGAGTTDHNVILPASGPFTLSVPVEGNLTSLALLRDGTEIANAGVSSGQPALSILSPGTGETWTGGQTLHWTATDPAGRLMTYTVSYSADGGVTWTPLAVDLPVTELAIDPQYLAGLNVTFRIIATAGIDQGQVISEVVTLGNRPALQLSANSVEFGSVTSGQFADRSLTVRNTGTGRLTLDGLTIDRDVFRSLTDAPFRVRARSERALPVRIAPRAAGQESGTLSFSANDEAQTALALPLRATVFDRPVPSGTVFPSSINFGDVPTGQARELPVTVGNTGSAPLNVTSVSILNARFNAVAAGAFTLSPGASRTFMVRFAPLSAGEQSGSLSIATNDPATPSLRVELRGTGLLVPQPQIDINVLSLDFQGVNINQSRSLTFNIRNGGTGPLTISAFNLSNPLFAVSSPNVPVGVAAGATQVVSLRFTPTATGVQTGVVTIVSDDPARPQVNVALTGNGLPAATFPFPRISSVHPAALTAGIPGFTLSVTGSNFTASSQGQWNGTALPTRFLSPAELKITVPAQTIASPNTAAVTISNPAPGGGTSNALSVFVDPPGPAARIVNFNLVGCPSLINTLTVTDRLFTPITALGGGNLSCSEDGTVIPCTANPALQLGSRLSVLIVLHASVSIGDAAKQRLDIGSMQRYANTFIDAADILDRVAITQMDNGVRLRADFRDAENRASLRDQVNQLLFPLGNGTALFDAVEDGVNRLLRETTRRKTLLVFTGSENTYNTNGPRDLDAFSQFLQTSGVPVYFVPLGDALTNPTVLNQLNQMALDSGGNLFSETGIDFGPLMARLSATLHNQQLLNYNTPNRDGQPHQLKITISIPGATFTTARSYSGCR